MTPVTESISLANLVSARLSELGWSIKDAERETGISYRHLQRILHDEGYSPRGTTLEKLARLGIPKSTLALAAFCSLESVSVA